MNEIVVLGVLTGTLGLLLWMVMSQIYRISGIIDNFDSSQDLLDDDFKQQLYDLMTMALEDTVGNIEMPNWKDHLAGAFMPMLQNRFFGGVNNLDKGLSSLAGYGQEEIETEKAS